MKKFYYQNRTSQDKTPIVLDRRHTMDITNEMKEEQNGMSSRAASVSNLVELAELPTIPRVGSREVSKSFSESVPGKVHYNASKKKIVTETDLSSSWLYKSMQASVNARFKSPRKSSVQQTDDLSPVELKDPNLKPVPVKYSSGRNKSCLYNFATMIAISMCTVGFLASIAGIIYVEIFATTNLTSLQTSEMEVDLSNIDLDSREDNVLLTTDRFDIDEQEISQESSNKIDEKVVLTSINDHEDKTGFINRYIDVAKSDETEVNRYINSTNSKIKFQDGETIIYEVNSSDSVGYRKVFKSLDDFGDGNHEGIVNKTEDNHSKSKSSKAIEGNVKEKLDTLLDPLFEKLKVPPISDSMGLFDTNMQDSDRHQNQLRNDLEKTGSDDKIKYEDLSETVLNFNDSVKPGIEITFDKVHDSSETFNVSKIFHSVNFELEAVPNSQTNVIFHDNQIESVDDVKENKPMSSDLTFSSKFEDVQESQAVEHEVKLFPSVQYVDQSIENEHDIHSMVMVIDEPEVSTDSFFSNRNGEIFPLSELSSSKPSVDSASMQPGSADSDSSKQSLPVDMKVSLAEAMKHLQVLDVSNKHLTSRVKTSEPKDEPTRRNRSSVLQREALERMRYLHRVRHVLFGNLQ